MRGAVRLRLQGLVQGCGVRPAIARLAQQFELQGWVENTGDHVRVHLQGADAALQACVDALPAALPVVARLDAYDVAEAAVDPRLQGFAIRASGNVVLAAGLPDIPADRAVCWQCLQEMHDPQSRRYRWPFIACATCGPRYSWLKALPFDRTNTTFSGFRACVDCETERALPDDKRFGMELIACQRCGPQVHYLDAHQQLQGDSCFGAMARCLRSGGVVALQGFSGFQLLALASDAQAVAKIRHFKSRRTRPLALLAKSLADIEQVAQVGSAEAQWLTGPHRPIVLLSRHDISLWPWVAPGNPRWGIMLPAHGMHAMLLDALADTRSDSAGGPDLLIATSANLRGEPVAGEVGELLPWLGKGIDAICHHTVPIWQVQDDSVVAVLDDGPLMLRRARGFSHEILDLSEPASDEVQPDNALGAGAFLKTTVALRNQGRVLLSQYLGDMDSIAVGERKRLVADRIMTLCHFTPTVEVNDAHPDAPLDTPVLTGVESSCTHVPVFHHRAHVNALLAEHGQIAPALVAAWDGIGYGEDGQWWGSEVFAVAPSDVRPVFGLAPFALPGGDRCAREPWRILVSLLLAAGIDSGEIQAFLQQTHHDDVELSKEASFADVQHRVVAAVVKGQPFPMSTSMGRFIEGMAALLLGVLTSNHEGEAACRLEYAAAGARQGERDIISMTRYEDAHGVQRWSWQPMLVELWSRLQAGEEGAVLARILLDSLAECLLASCHSLGVKTLGVSGGCFQNIYWLNYLRIRCQEEGFRWVRPMRFPPNDGAIALGQVFSVVSPNR